VVGGVVGGVVVGGVVGVGWRGGQVDVWAFAESAIAAASAPTNAWSFPVIVVSLLRSRWRRTTTAWRPMGAPGRG
jgi:hypothetical protein